jgi:hypothetical protein
VHFSLKIIEQQHANEDHFHSLMLLTMLLLNQLLPLEEQGILDFKLQDPALVKVSHMVSIFQ